MMKSRTSAAIAVLALFACAAVAATPEQINAVKARKVNYKEIGGAFKAVSDEVKSGSPNMAAVRPAARDLAARALRSTRFFIPGSGPSSGVPTRAKALIWSEQANFNRIQQQMVTAANALNAAALASDPARLKTARDALGATCKACHDRYREED